MILYSYHEFVILEKRTGAVVHRAMFPRTKTREQHQDGYWGAFCEVACKRGGLAPKDYEVLCLDPDLQDQKHIGRFFRLNMDAQRTTMAQGRWEKDVWLPPI